MKTNLNKNNLIKNKKVKSIKIIREFKNKEF